MPIVTSATPIVIQGGTRQLRSRRVSRLRRTAPTGSPAKATVPGSRLNRLLQTDERRQSVVAEVFLPDEIEKPAVQAERAAVDGNIGSHSAGFEGIAVLPGGCKSKGKSKGKGGGDYQLLVAQQRGWDYTSSEVVRGARR